MQAFKQLVIIYMTRISFTDFRTSIIRKTDFIRNTGINNTTFAMQLYLNICSSIV